jgi:hypothetical protein
LGNELEKELLENDWEIQLLGNESEKKLLENE